MSHEIQNQINFVVITLCNGMLLIAGYDILRCLRWLIPHSSLFVWIGDLLYWFFAAFPTFYLLFYYNEGIIRWYGLLSLLVGAILYERGISGPIRSCLNRWGGRWRSALLRKFRNHKRKQQ